MKQLIGFLIRASGDHRIGPHHVVIYTALFQQWCMNNAQNPIQVTQTRIREVAKVGRTTYHKCMRELEDYGYIKYIRSHSPVLGSLVYLVEMGG
ncbi:hypothetical protein [Niabella ginsengisoli]|uniref:Helix-turn-helix domain-containing protein n=1 Tax=Niabella ginsengisoli TaxID=522298 RepID=A0ABS9SHX2_9BACT|nr:hypothetical protein [Niabella ginsengisoli]MCH5597925.1 hypothetical protein [Niabella ginsengisoli]